MSILRQIVAPPAAQKSVIGPGAHSMTYGAPLWEKSRDERRFLREALGTYHTSRHIRRAEMTIANRIGGIPWHLADAEGNEVNDESPQNLQDIRDLLEKPTGGVRVGNQPVTRRELWGLTARHMGLVNVAFWYLEEIDRFTSWPQRILYIRPDRMTPATDKGGNLVGWVLDKGASEDSGTPLEANEVLCFYLDPPDEGFYGSGLVEAALALAQKVRLADTHEIGVLGSGGRLAGVFSPKADSAVSDEIFNRLTLDLRNIVEMPDAAKRSIVARAPVDFTPTTADMSSLLMSDLSRLTQEQTFGLWGVPPETAGYSAPGGLNSGEGRKASEAALFQNAIQPRLDSMYEVIQYALLDRLDPIGVNLQLVLEPPTFDDEMPRYDMATKTLNLPLRNIERRAILGLDPFGDPALDNAVWMPMGLVELSVAPDTMKAALKAKLPTGHPAVDKLLPRLRKDLAAFLESQRSEIAGKVRQRAAHLARKPTDSDVWWSAKWDAALEKVLRPYAQTIADLSAERAQQALRPGKADFDDLVGNRVLGRLLERVGKRIKGINETTREAVAKAVREGIEAGDGAAQLGDRIEAAAIFDEYRAELIARTESATVLNESQVESFREFGVEKVTVIDGDLDDECATANGQEWTLEEASDNPIAHPNCVRDFAPIVTFAKAVTIEEPMPEPEPKPDPWEAWRAEAAGDRKALMEMVAALQTVNVNRTIDQTLHTVTLTTTPPIVEAPIVNVYNEPPIVDMQPVAEALERGQDSMTHSMKATLERNQDALTEGMKALIPPPIVLPAPIVNYTPPPALPQDIRIIEMPERSIASVKRVKRDNRGLITEIDERTVEE